MSLRKRLKTHNEDLDTGPLNDILFILMFFFLIISTLANPNVIRVSNPKAKSDAKANDYPINVILPGSVFGGELFFTPPQARKNRLAEDISPTKPLVLPLKSF